MDLKTFCDMADTKAGNWGADVSKLYLSTINKCVKRVPPLRPSSENVSGLYIINYIYKINDFLY